MMKKILTLLLVFITTAAYAEGFMLPKSFSLSKKDLPPVEEKAGPVPTDISLANLVRSYEYDYESTFKSTLSALTQYNVTPVEYDTAKGQIRARTDSGRELFVFLLPSKEKLTHVRITPADGHYDISVDMVKEIFKAIDRTLYSGV